MDVPAARVLAASLETDSRALELSDLRLRALHREALALMAGSRHIATNDASRAMGLTAGVAVELAEMSIDLHWRADLIGEADDRATLSFGILPSRRLDHVALSLPELAERLRYGTPSVRAGAEHELIVRSEADAASAANFISQLGADHLVELLSGIEPGAGFGMGLATVMARAATTGRQEVHAILAAAATGLHFRAQDNALNVVERDFEVFDIAAHGGRPDGVVSLNDLEAIATDDTTTGRAARWLLANPNVLGWIAMGADNTAYLDADGGLGAYRLMNGTFERPDIAEYRQRRNAAFVAWPLLGSIDTAAEADTSRADGFVSRDDVVAALQWPDLADHQHQALLQILSDGAYDTTGYSERLLTAASWAPVVGDAVDGLAAAYFLAEGNSTLR